QGGGGEGRGGGVGQVAIDLGSLPGGGTGEAAAASVPVTGAASDDHISIVSSRSSVIVNGLPGQVTIDGAESNSDTLVVNGGAGNDIINASALNPGQINLTINGGAGDDLIIGSGGNDLVNGRARRDASPPPPTPPPP